MDSRPKVRERIRKPERHNGHSEFMISLNRLINRAWTPELGTFRDLLYQVLMHLPRVADVGARITLHAASCEIDRVAELQMETQQIAWPMKSRIEIQSPPSINDLRCDYVDEVVASQILQNCHYLRSHRRGRYYGLFKGETDVPWAIGVTSELDVPHLRQLAADWKVPKVRVLSRVYAFDSAPRNAISFLLSRLAAIERGAHGTDLLLTYVNPNLGFTGSSYKASGWTLIGHEPGTVYTYIDGRYVTDRRLVSIYGTADFCLLQEFLGRRIQRSQPRLKPLAIFAKVIGQTPERPPMAWAENPGPVQPGLDLRLI